MVKSLKFLKPSVDKKILILLAGFAWIAVGAMLLFRAYQWILLTPLYPTLISSTIGGSLAIIIHHFGFLKIVDKNLDRIIPMSGKRCIFSFIPWKSYLIIVLMILMGFFLRLSPIPKIYLTTVYIAIGMSLILSSIRYLRVFLMETFKNRQS
ncbi:MAG: hypothetical protein HOD92_27200 [Deltaproteobacteria bacterium]|jgi:hypothetical protein|nr:hypothetical protein [Deltaproteobacteria bacterium]MBT4526778.1 hypothetical protein [Deltaproteobacteria bacterium]